MAESGSRSGFLTHCKYRRLVNVKEIEDDEPSLCVFHLVNEQWYLQENV